MSLKQKELEKRKLNESSDSSDNDSDYHTDDDEPDFDKHEYRKFLAIMFPSKHLNEKIKSGNQLQKKLQEKEKELIELEKLVKKDA